MTNKVTFEMLGGMSVTATDQHQKRAEQQRSSRCRRNTEGDGWARDAASLRVRVPGDHARTSRSRRVPTRGGCAGRSHTRPIDDGRTDPGYDASRDAERRPPQTPAPIGTRRAARMLDQAYSERSSGAVMLRRRWPGRQSEARKDPGWTAPRQAIEQISQSKFIAGARLQRFPTIDSISPSRDP